MKLKVSQETICKIIELAREKRYATDQHEMNFRDPKNEDVIVIKSSDMPRYFSLPSYESVRMSRKRLQEFLETLTYGEILEVESLMSYGRGDFDSLSESLEFFKARYPGDSCKKYAIEYIIGKPLDEYLDNALRKMYNSATQ